MRSVDFTPQIDPVNLCVAAQSMGHIFGIHGEYNTPKLLNFLQIIPQPFGEWS